MDLLEDDGRVLEHLWHNFLQIKKYVLGLPEAVLDYRYDTGKWTIREILVHLS